MSNVRPRQAKSAHSRRIEISQTHQGGCLCGSVRFEASGRPLMVMVCHCSMCQRATGSAFSVEPVFLKTNVQFHGGPLASYAYQSPDHGRRLNFTFCPTCGNRLGLTLDRFPQVQVTYAGTFDDPAWLTPDSHIFTKSAVPWTVLPKDVRCFAGHLFELDGTPARPINTPDQHVSHGNSAGGA